MVLELTLKHVKALSGLLEQQQQKIIALQKDLQISKFDAVMLCGHCCIYWNYLKENCAVEMIF